MKRRWLLAVLTAAVLLCGCEKQAADNNDRERTAEILSGMTEETVPATVPADGNADDVTCKGSYTGVPADTVVATAGDAELTGRQLQVWYWAEIARYRQANNGEAPDFDRPLDMQSCMIDSSVRSWQQYFLEQALTHWHTAQALIQHSQAVPLSREEAYQPNRMNTEKYMYGMPAAEVLYGYYLYYRPNSMHQTYLDEIPQMLERMAMEKGYRDAEAMAMEEFGASAEEVEAFAYFCNRGYMYFTHLSHDMEPTQKELDDFYAGQGSGGFAEGTSVDLRQILLIPGETVFGKKEALPEVTVAADGTVSCEETLWASCEAEARQFLEYWQKENHSAEAAFAEAARRYTKDPGTKPNGGLYRGIRRGQMTKVIDAWCFDPVRQAGDTAVLRSDYGIHILYLSDRRTVSREAAEQEYHCLQLKKLITEAKKDFPMEVDYSAVSLQEARGRISTGDLLYPDIAHERFPEIPLYLQQDYPKTMYGGFKLSTNGCGITSFAMVASYLTDDERTPPQMCALYGRYSHTNGTDGMIFNNESAVQGFYLREKTYEPRVARAALEEGHIVVSIQHPGYWTRGGHYIVCESIDEEGMVRVRDSNIYNYSRVRAHAEDVHRWWDIVENGSGYWIFEHKTTRIPACSRCGAPEGVTGSLLCREYICEKCVPALLRRNTYLNS